jgi:transposase InsO family protein
MLRILEHRIQAMNDLGSAYAKWGLLAGAAERSALHGLIAGSLWIVLIMDLWAYQGGVKIAFSRPGEPTSNADIKTFNGTLRAECLDAHWFGTVEGAKETIEAWRREHNESRTRRTLGEKTLKSTNTSVLHSRLWLARSTRVGPLRIPSQFAGNLPVV